MRYLLQLISLSFLFLCVSNAQIFIPFSFWQNKPATLTISDGPTYNFGIIPTNTTVEKAFTVTNTGAGPAMGMSANAFATASFTYKGGTYPGTGGTCTSSLAALNSCLIVVRANSASATTSNDTVSINYTGASAVTRAISAQFTATTITSLFVEASSGNFNIGSTQQLKCYGGTSDGGVIDLTTACSWSSANSAIVSVDNTSSKGLITGVSLGGPLNITATFGASNDTSAVTVDGAPPSFIENGIGLFARYFSTTSAGGTPNDPYSVLQNQRIDATVNFNWAAGSNPAGGVDDFAAKWTGQIRAPTSGSYCVGTVSDDGVRLWIDNTLVINNWTDHAPTLNTGNFTFVANQKYDVFLEFYENGGGAEIRLRYVAGACGTPVAVTQTNLFPIATRALDLQSTTAPRYTNMYRGFAMNGTVGGIANAATITGMVGGGGATPVNATASNANGTGMAYASSDRSQSIDFDGIDDYFSVASSTLPTGSNARTLAFWVNPHSTATDEPIAYYGNNTANNGFGAEVLSTGIVRLSTIGTQCDSNTAITFNSWTHVAVTLNVTTANIYINGAIDRTCTLGATPNTTAATTLYVGRNIGGSNFFEGTLDDLGFWNIVLTAGEINTLFERGRVINPP
ncbi:Ig-like domain-containing protein [bacterium]|nr:Ig-like domain-containing protein [bacterium]